jgi:CheY-like chemotaxis protein
MRSTPALIRQRPRLRKGSGGKLYTVLVVEDNLADVGLRRQALQDLTRLVQVHRVRDGVEALAFLRREGPYASAPRPDVIVLDLNMAKTNGHAVLTEVKQDPQLKRIPVVILPSSTKPEEIGTALRRGGTPWSAFLLPETKGPADGQEAYPRAGSFTGRG